MEAKKDTITSLVKISVIIPVYNVAPYLPACLESLLGQTLKDWEAICIDDGSTDNGWEILSLYASKDERIRIFHQENRGVSFARNLAIGLAQGEFLFFLDPDDWVADEGVFHDLYTAAVENNVLICGGSFREHFGNRIVSDWSNTKNSKYVFEKNGLMQYSDYQFDYGWVRFIYNREFIFTNDLTIPEYSFYEDPVFFVYAMDRAQTFYTLKRPVYCYRRGHKPRVISYQKVLDLISAMTEIVQLAKSKGYAELQELEKQRILDDYCSDIAAFLVENGHEELHNKLNALGELLFSGEHNIEYEIVKAQTVKLQKQIADLKESKDWRLGYQLLRFPRAVKNLFRRSWTLRKKNI